MPRQTKISRHDSVRPGDILYNLCVIQNVTQSQVSKESGISKQTFNNIIQGKSRITPPIALGLAKFFKNDKFYWMRLQNEYDFWELEQGKNGEQET